MITSEEKEQLLKDILLEKVAVINPFEVSWEETPDGKLLPPILFQINELEKERPDDGRGIILPHPYSLMALELFREENLIHHPSQIYKKPISFEIRSKILSLLSIYKRFLIWMPKHIQIDVTYLQEKDIIKVMPKIDISSVIDYYDIAPYKPYIIAYFQSTGIPCDSESFDHLLEKNLEALYGKIPTNPIAEVFRNSWADVRIGLWASRMASLPLFTTWSIPKNTSQLEQASKLLRGRELNTRINVMVKTILSQENAYSLPSMKKAIDCRDNPEFIELHNHLEECTNILNRDQSLEAWDNQVQKATKNIKRSHLYRQLSGFCTYASIPLTIFDLTTGVPAGTAVGIIGAGLQLGGDTLNKKSKWVLLGN